MNATPPKFRLLLTLVLCASAAAAAITLAPVATAAHADSTAPRFVRVAGGLSLDEAVAMAERRFQARVVRADSRVEGDRTVYVLRLLNEAGRVWTVRVDAATGSFL